MLYYIKIDLSEGLDESEGNFYIENVKQKSKQCICCNFYFFNKMNFRHDKIKCDGCYNCLNYEKMNYQYSFKVIYTKKSAFRTVSNYFVFEIEKLLEESNLNERFGWLYKDEKCEIEPDDLDNLENFGEIELEVGSPCGIEPQSLINECPAIRL